MKFGIRKLISRWKAGEPERQRRRNKKREERSDWMEHLEEVGKRTYGDLGRYSPYHPRRED